MTKTIPAALAEGSVDRFGHYIVTREEVLDFARRFDPQPFHIDDEAAAAHPFFNGISASGWHTTAMVMRMVVDRWAELGLRTLAGLGIEDLEWSRPVYPGDVLEVSTKVLETRPSDSRRDAYLVRSLSRVINQDSQEVMRYISTVLFCAN